MLRIGNPNPLAVYNHPMFTREINWAHHLLNIEEAWTSVTGKGVRVGVVDTGCDYTHDDLVGKVFGGINCTPNHDNGYMDSVGHGTSCASIIAARKTGKGVAGIAPDASLFIAKAVDDAGIGEAEYLKCAIESCIAAECSVINVSLGSVEAYPEIEEVIQRGNDLGIIFVAAAGNSGDNKDGGPVILESDGLPLEDWPARLPYVISVAAINKEGKVALWSSPGSIEFSAPGVDITTCFPGNKYAVFSGTSQASPFISGVCALLKERNPNIDMREAVKILDAHSLSIGASSQYGAGIINVGSAVKALAKFKGGDRYGA